MKKVSRRPRRKISVPKACFFCSEKREPSFWERESLQRLITERGKIVSRARNGLCSGHQKELAVSVKHGRFLGLI